MIEENIQFQKILDLLESFLGPSIRGFDDNLQAQFDCPACAIDKGLYGGDGKHNLEVNVRHGVFKCWACSQTNNMSGSIYKLIRTYGNKQLLEAYKNEIYTIRQSKLYDLNLHNGDFKTEEESDFLDDAGVSLPLSYKPIDYTSKNIPRQVISYLQNRGIPEFIVKRFRLGYTTNQDPDYQVRNRIIIPSYDRFGELNYWTGRDFTGKRKLKYYNHKAERMHLVFNENLVNFDGDVNLVEGPFDHLVVPNSIPLLSKVLEPDYALYIALYKRCNAHINIILDDDAKSDAVKLYKLLNTGRLYGRIRIVPFNNTTDVKFDPSKVYEVYGQKGIRLLLKRARQLTLKEEVLSF